MLKIRLGKFLSKLTNLTQKIILKKTFFLNFTQYLFLIIVFYAVIVFGLDNGLFIVSNNVSTSQPY